MVFYSRCPCSFASTIPYLPGIAQCYPVGVEVPSRWLLGWRSYIVWLSPLHATKLLDISNTFTSAAEQQAIYYAWLHVFLTESYS